MTIGQTTTDGTILDSIPLEGITISSDDGMLKPMLAQYSPTIRGIANSPARVIVKQNGNIIYEKMCLQVNLNLMMLLRSIMVI